MNFEDLNNKYLRLKMAVEKYKTDLETFDKNLKQALADKENAENALKTAKTPKEQKTFQESLNKVLNEVADIKSQIEFVEERQQSTQEEIEALMDIIRAIPDIKQQCSEAVDKNTERKIAKFEKQKKEQEEKKSVLVQLKNIIEKHPQAQIYVNNIENKSLEISKKELEIKNVEAEISKVEEEINKLDPKDPNYAVDKAKLDGDKAKLDGDKAKLDGEYSTLKTDRQASRDELKKLLNNPKYNEHIDNLTTRNALDKNINNCDRLIRRSENKISDYTQARGNMHKENEQEPIEQPVSQSQPTKWQTFKDDFKNIFKNQPGDPSIWSKIGKTVTNLFTKQQALPEPSPETEKPENSFFKELKVDNAMQYEVVRDMFNSNKESIDKNVKESSKARQQNQNDGSR